MGRPGKRWRGKAMLAVAALLTASAVTGVLWLRRGGDTSAGWGSQGESMVHTNRLIDEKSPYLLQHAHNPVDWYPWGEEAFERARREDRPVFLSVGYSTCHWCHVMARESFEDEQIARLLNASFVSIKVDREERPDIDQVYMDAVQAMTGRGGWPMSVFLTPEGRPFYGGTYFPREQFEGVLTAVARMFREDRAKVEETAEEVARTVESMVGVPERTAGSRLGRGLVRRALEVLHRQFDAEHGGFGSAPKFPPHTALPLLLHEHRRGGGDGLLGMAKLTLDQMALGGIRDHVGGGFHRYATDGRWFLPHFEKMLYDNALLSRNYVEAYVVTKDPFYRGVAEEIYSWVEREMTSPMGGFFSALDAESEGVEGKFYLWRREEIAEVLGEEEAELFAAVYNIEEGGNYREEATGRATGESIPYLRRRPSALAEERGVAAPELEARLARAKEKLLAARDGRPRPRRDDKILTAWNGLMIGSLAFAGRVLEEPAYVARAERAARFVLGNLEEKGRLMRRWREGEARFPGYLEDSVFLAQGLLDLYEATGESEWLDHARRIVEAAIAEFWDEADGGFFSTAARAERLFVRPKEALDHPLPSGNGAAARLLLRLGEETHEARYAEYAESTLQAMVPWMERAPFGADTLILAAAEYADRQERARASAAGPAASEPRAVTAERHPVKLTARPSRAVVRRGDTFEISLELEIAKGWHINSHRPHQEFLIPTSVQVRGGPPVSVGEISYPPGEDITLAGDRVSVYTGRVKLSVPATVSARAAAGKGTVKVALRFQACDDTSCLPPEEVEVEVGIEVGAKSR